MANFITGFYLHKTQSKLLYFCSGVKSGTENPTSSSTRGNSIKNYNPYQSQN